MVSQQAQTGNGRMISMDVLRVLSMFLIVTGHFLFYGVRNHPTLGTFHPESVSETCTYLILQLIYVFTVTGVNCFVLISGYFLIEKTTFRSALLKIWVETIFYSLLLSLIFSFCGGEKIPPATWLDHLSPFPRREYWFITQYMGLALLAPFLAYLGKSLNQKQYLFLLGVLLLLFFKIPFGRSFTTGMSINWFILLFFVGGYFRKFALPDWLHTRTVLCLTVTAAGVYLFHLAENLTDITQPQGAFTLRYTGNNALTFLTSICLFACFTVKKETRQAGQFIGKLAPYTLGIYLCHEHSAVRDFLWNRLLPEICHHHLLLPGLFFTLLVFLSCAGIDFLREQLFKRMGINRAIQKLGEKLPQPFGPKKEIRNQ